MALDDRYQSQRDKEQTREFAFTGIISCGHCGCALSAQIQKERYVYYHCTGFKGDCGEPYVREEVIEAAFTKGLKSLVLNRGTFGLLTKSLRDSHAEETTFHAGSVQRLESECARLQRRIDAMYVDRLDGVIDVATFERNSAAWREEIRDHRRTITRHEQANESYMELGIRIVEMSQNAWRVFDGQTPAEKRRLLNYMVLNSKWAAGKLVIEWRKPFSILAEWMSTPNDETPSGGESGGGLSSKVGVGECNDYRTGWPRSGRRRLRGLRR